MANLDIIQPSFAGGEVTEALQSREDLAKQHIALKTCKNAIVTSTGSVLNRAGTTLVSEVDDSTKEYRLIPFIFSTEQAYAIPFGDNAFEIVKDGELLLRDLVDAAYKWTLSGSGTSEYYLELAAGGDPGILEPHIVLENGIQMTADTAGSLGIREWDWADNDALGYSTVYVRLSDSTDPDSKAQGYVRVHLMFTSPYSSGTQNSNLDYAQSADVMYLPNPAFTPYKLTRTSDTAWTLTAIDFQDGPYRARDDGDEDITMTPGAKTGSGVTVEISEAITWATVGLPIRFGYENPLDQSIIEWGWGKVASIVDSDTITVDIEKDLGFEYLLNPKFRDGLSFWQDKSTSASSTSYDAINNVAELNQGASGNAFLTQQITVNAYELLTVEIVVDTIGGGGTLRVYAGNTALAQDVLAIQSIVAPDTYSYTTLIAQPTGTTVHLTLQTFAGTPSYTHEVSRVSVMRQDLSTTHWRRGAWDATLGWPERVTLFEQAVFYANNNDQPDTAWKTKTGEYESFPFNTPPLDTDAVVFTLASERVNAIQWLRAYGELAIGTTGSEWRVSRGANSDTITPTSIDAKVKSNTGSASIRPLIIGNSLLFIRQGENTTTGKKFCKVYELGYSLDSDGYRPTDLTVLAPHLFEGHNIKEWGYQESPNATVWCVRDDGVLLGLTFIKEQEIWAWHQHDTEGTFESICVVPEDGEDAVYFIVKRWVLISGARTVKRFIERLNGRINDEDIYDYYFVDSGVTLDIENDIAVAKSITDIVFDGTKIQVRYTTGAPLLNDNDYIYISNVVGTTEINKKTFRVSDSTNVGGGETGFYLKDKEGDDYTDASQYSEYVSGGEIRKGITEITGLEHLRGKSVSVLADGSAYTKTVIPEQDIPPFGGKVELNVPAIVVHAGLPYTTEIETLPHDFVGSNGVTSQGKDKSLVKTNIYFNKSRYAEVGAGGTAREINFSDQSSGNNPPPLFTGVKEKKVDDSFTKLTQTRITNDQPLPMEIMGIISNVDFKEK